MSLDGLKTILEKEEIVVTYQAQDFIDRPKDVNDFYKTHLRTYVPMNSGASDDYLSVESFTKRFVLSIQNGKVPRGYISADFGYGKTSTGLYVWDEAMEAGILTIPPFQLNTLNDFITATFGWVNFILGQVQPSLQSKLSEVYHLYNSLSIKAVARKYEIDENKASLIAKDRPQILDLTPQDATHFFRDTTAIVIEAGFKGLFVIADEVQQYLEPEIKSGKGDPIGPLFNLIQNLGSQAGLAFGLLLIIPSKELGVINDQRGDLIDRLRNHALDLKTIYDRGFPIRLWNHLAKTFDFDNDSSNIIRSETLYSLGEIAVRGDLANGPRTVVNAFRCAINNYLSNSHPGSSRYSPINLITDFLNGTNAFDGTKRIQEVVNRALEHSYIREHKELRDAVCLAAAFPIDGASSQVQNAFNLVDAFSKLRENLFGEVVLEVGNRANPGTTLCGLEAEEDQADWLLLAIREFSRNYHENSSLVMARALKGFKELLKTIVFRNDWKIANDLDTSFASSAGLILEGSFASFRKEFPGRICQALISFDDESVAPFDDDYDVVLIFRLHRYLDVNDHARQDIVKSPLSDTSTFRIVFDLNLMRRSLGGFNRAIVTLLGKVVAPEQLTPLFALSLYGYFHNLNSNNRVPKTEQPLLTMQFMPGLLEGVLNVILDKNFGKQYDAAGSRLIEKLMLSVLRTRYGNAYHTLMMINTWRSSLRDYSNMLNRLPSLLHKQGYLTISGSKDIIAKQLNLTNTTLDNFVSTFPDLIEYIGDFRKTKAGEVKFKLHPLEERIREWLSTSPDQMMINGKKVHTISQKMIVKLAKPLGYKVPEVEQLIQLLNERSLISIEREGIFEVTSSNIKQQDVIDAAERLKQRVAFGIEVFPDAVDLKQFEDDSKNLYRLATHGNTSNPKFLELLFAQTNNYLRGVEEILLRHQNNLVINLNRSDEQANRLLIPTSPSNPIYVKGTPYSSLFDTFYDKLNQVVVDQQIELASIKERIKETRNLLNKHNKSDEEIKLEKTNVQKLSTAVDNLEVSIANLSNEIKGYMNWEDVFRLRQDALLRINRLQSNHPLNYQIENLDREINLSLASEISNALSKAVFIEPKVRKIIESAGIAQEQAKQRFEDLQNRYKAALEQVNLPSGARLEFIVFNPIEPDHVYNQFYNSVLNLLVEVFDFTDDQIQQLCSQLRQMALTENTNKTLAEKSKDLEEELKRMSEEIPYSQVSNSNAVKDEKEFRTILREIAELQKRVAACAKKVIELNEQNDLSLDELRFVTHLPHDAQINIVDLLKSENFGNGIVTWNTIRSLWEKNWIQITIKKLPRSSN